jgi:hypothetical protein
MNEHYNQMRENRDAIWLRTGSSVGNKTQQDNMHYSCEIWGFHGGEDDNDDDVDASTDESTRRQNPEGHYHKLFLTPFVP